MNAALVAAAGITAVAVFFFLVESDGLSQIHARVRTQLFNTTRWAFVIALTWLLIPATSSEPSSDRPVVIVGMVGLAGALMLVPVRWVVRIGGREHAWELRSARLEVARLANRARRDPASATPERISQTMARIEQLRAPEVRELCDLMLSELEDLQAGDEAWNEAGRRSIRIDQLSRRLWPGEVPPPEFDSDEATFRWRLYRTFGRLMEVGAMERSAETAARFQQLLASLDEFRRSDTKAFIADVRRSGNRWLKSDRKRGPWIECYDFGSLGPRGLEEVRSIWGRDAALWGAQLDDDDMRALEEDLARRAPSEGAAAPGPDSSAHNSDSAAPVAGAPAGTR